MNFNFKKNLKELFEYHYKVGIKTFFTQSTSVNNSEGLKESCNLSLWIEKTEYPDTIYYKYYKQY